MDGAFLEQVGQTGLPAGEELALTLQKVVCPVGLVPSELAMKLDTLTPILKLECVKGRMQCAGAEAGGEQAARAVATVVRQAVTRIDDGIVRQAADLLLGVSRTRGLPRKDRRKDAADALTVSEVHFRKRRELPLLREVAEEICAMEAECSKQEDSWLRASGGANPGRLAETRPPEVPGSPTQGPTSSPRRLSKRLILLVLAGAVVLTGVTVIVVADVRSPGGHHPTATAAQPGLDGQQVVVSGVHQRSAQICGPNQAGQSVCTQIFNTPSRDTLYPLWWWVGTVTIKGWTGPGGSGNSLGSVRCEVPKVQLDDNRTVCLTSW